MSNIGRPGHVSSNISSPLLMRSLLKVGAVGVLLPAVALIAVAQCLLPGAVPHPKSGQCKVLMPPSRSSLPHSPG